MRLKEIWAIRIRLQLAKRARDLALFNLAIDSKLRGCDLVALRVCDVAQGQRVVSRATVLQRKTQRSVQFELTEQSRDSVSAWLNRTLVLGDPRSGVRPVAQDDLPYDRSGCARELAAAANAARV